MASTPWMTANGSEGLALKALADRDFAARSFTYTALSTGGAVTLNATASFVNCLVAATGQTSSVAMTTPSAAQILAAIPNGQTGSSFFFMLRNNNATAGIQYNFTGGTGVTTVLATGATAAVPGAGAVQLYLGIVTNAASGSEAVSVYPLVPSGSL